MEDYKELIDILRDIDFVDSCEHCFFPCGGSGNCFVLKTADAIEQLVKERDAAIADISWLIINHYVCGICKHHDDDSSYCGTCGALTPNGKFEWRGVQE